MILQLVGLPCSGKSTLIKNAIKNNIPIKHFDIINADSDNNYSNFLSLVETAATKELCVLESALGFSQLKSIVLLYKPKDNIRLKNIIKRSEFFTASQDEQLYSQIIPAHFTIYTQKNFNKILNIFLKENYYE